MDTPYRGRFAPSPSGLLHAGSVVAALASWLDARAHAGSWRVRIEDVDRPRCTPGAAEGILRQLAELGLRPDETPAWQSRREGLYAQALETLQREAWAYPCTCSRKSIATYLAAHGSPQSEGVYPGLCRPLTRVAPLRLEPVGPPAAWRVRVDGSPAAAADGRVHWVDRRLGAQSQDLAQAVGDFVVRRADGLWSYQLAVAVDDAEQGITDIVRGEDLADNTPRQIHLQRLLGLSHPRTLHTPLVCDAEGHKLSKHRGAPPVDTQDPLAVLRAAGRVLGLAPEATSVPAWLEAAVRAWSERWRIAP